MDCFFQDHQSGISLRKQLFQIQEANHQKADWERRWWGGSMGNRNWCRRLQLLLQSQASPLICKSSLQISQISRCDLMFENRSSPLDGRQALRTWVTSQITTRACGAPATPCTLQVCMWAWEAYARNCLHHNNKQMCKLLSERNVIVSSSHSQKIISDNYTLITPFFQLSFTARGNTADSLLFLSGI